MKITCISDLHGHLPELPGGDLLIVAGDLTARDTACGYYDFNNWICDLDYKNKIVIAGNHDGLLQKDWFSYLEGSPAFEYLQDSGTEIYMGRNHRPLKVWGSPWTPAFWNWHFMKHSSAELKERWDLIPVGTDILVTHGPMYGVLDTIGNGDDRPLGCVELRTAIERIKPKLHICGHIHGGYGKLVLKHEGLDTLCVNASIMDERYRPVNTPIVVEI